MPFPESKASPIVIKKISDGERPSRPKKGEDLGLSNGLWRIIQSSLAHRAEERPSISVFVDFLEEATPDIAMLEQLAKFDANSEEHIQNLFHMFECRDNTLFGMREQETLVAIEVFDRVGLLTPTSSHPSAGFNFVWFQVLNSSLDDPVPRTRCLHGLQKVSARCGLLPKSYWISHSSLAESDDAPSGIGMVSKAHQRSVDGRLVVVKAVSPDCIENFDAFKRVRLLPPKHLLSKPPSIWVPYRECARMRSCGNAYGTQTWSISLGSAPILLSPLYTLGFPMGTYPSMCTSTPMPINLVWYVATPNSVLNPRLTLTLYPTRYWVSLAG